MNMEEKKLRYEQFYGILGADKDIVFELAREMYNDGDYMCICTFCGENSPSCGHSCCQTGEPCDKFKVDKRMYEKIKKIKERLNKVKKV